MHGGGRGTAAGDVLRKQRRAGGFVRAAAGARQPAWKRACLAQTATATSLIMQLPLGSSLPCCFLMPAWPFDAPLPPEAVRLG